jgi:hypothetical protein
MALAIGETLSRADSGQNSEQDGGDGEGDMHRHHQGGWVPGRWRVQADLSRHHSSGNGNGSGGWDGRG